MEKSKQARLEKNGWKVGSVAEFLGLTSDEEAFIEFNLAAGSSVRFFGIGGNQVPFMNEACTPPISKNQTPDPSP